MSRFGCGAAMTRIVLSPHQWRERLGMGARRISACWAHFSFRAKVKETLAGDSGGANLDLIAALAFSDVSSACRRISHQPSARFPGSALPASSLGRCSRSASRCCHGIASSENVGRELLGFRQVHVLKCELPIATGAAAGTCAGVRGSQWRPAGQTATLCWQSLLRPFFSLATRSKLFWRGSSA